MTLKKTLILATAMLFASMSHAIAQESDTEVEALGAEEALETLVLPEIRVLSGNPFWLKGYQAFVAGEYERAEHSFVIYKNKLGPAVLLDPFTAFGGSGPSFPLAAGGLIVNAGLPVSPNINSAGIPSRITARGLRSNTELGIQAAQSGYAFASYWAGMAQIRQGDLRAAKVSMMDAIRYNGDFHEARMRVGLLNLLEGKDRLAQKRLDQLKRSCNFGPCGQGSDLAIYINVLEQAIETMSVNEETLLH